jgi:hypothetical protein
MAHSALGRFASAALHDQGLALCEASDRHIGREGRSVIATFKLDEIVRNLDNPRSDRLTLAAFRGGPKQARHKGLRRGFGLHDLDALAWLQGREIGRSSVDFRISDRFGKLAHQPWRCSPGKSSTPGAALELGHLLDDVALGQSREISIFRSARSHRAMTKSACKYAGFAPGRNDVR